MILEGAPGQGKSTISQYICQIHRMRILARDATTSLDSDHLDASVRLPFKVDLRDFATWLSGGNPFGTESSENPPAQSLRTLETFLAAFVRSASGGN